MLLFYYYVPESHITTVNNALFALGLGQVQEYDSCCWISKGEGQFRPLENSKPFIGQPGQENVVKVIEYKVEIICPSDLKTKVINMLKSVHPYEVPAYGFINLI
ncbi:MAG: NGG1p interacting factor NIF3 [Gammaproteobacteria bacterium]|nr:NGG1p interacting factor NIF3 [Gammaproteobacteria bacterium]